MGRADARIGLVLAVAVGVATATERLWVLLDLLPRRREVSSVGRPPTASPTSRT